MKVQTHTGLQTGSGSNTPKSQAVLSRKREVLSRRQTEGLQTGSRSCPKPQAVLSRKREVLSRRQTEGLQTGSSSDSPKSQAVLSRKREVL